MKKPTGKRGETTAERLWKHQREYFSVIGGGGLIVWPQSIPDLSAYVEEEIAIEMENCSAVRKGREEILGRVSKRVKEYYLCHEFYPGSWTHRWHLVWPKVLLPEGAEARHVEILIASQMAAYKASVLLWCQCGARRCEPDEEIVDRWELGLQAD